MPSRLVKVNALLRSPSNKKPNGRSAAARSLIMRIVRSFIVRRSRIVIASYSYFLKLAFSYSLVEGRFSAQYSAIPCLEKQVGRPIIGSKASKISRVSLATSLVTIAAVQDLGFFLGASFLDLGSLVIALVSNLSLATQPSRARSR